MDFVEPGSSGTRRIQAPRRPRVLLGASGSVAALDFDELCHTFCEWAEVRAVATRASLHYIDRASLPKDVTLYTDEDESSWWDETGDNVVHIELQSWADIMVIAPLSVNTLGKIASGLCDNLLTNVVFAWNYEKPLFVAPAMNALMWRNPFTEKHLISIDEQGIILIRPEDGKMAEHSIIYSTVMACPKLGNAILEPIQADAALRKPRILLGASGSVAALKLSHLCRSFSNWAEVRAVATGASLRFIDKASFPNVIAYTDGDEFSRWNTTDDSVLPVKLRHWADIMVIAPLSANTLGKIAGGLCDNLLTHIVYAWDDSKPLFVAPAMNTLMWNNPLTQQHIKAIEELGFFLILPDTRNGAMVEVSLIYSTVRTFVHSQVQPAGRVV
ncbi:hypothetical protein ABKV19_012066 [Rosa sericea]